jgi:hypothetical protein
VTGLKSIKNSKREKLTTELQYEKTQGIGTFKASLYNLLEPLLIGVAIGLEF